MFLPLYILGTWDCWRLWVSDSPVISHLSYQSQLPWEVLGVRVRGEAVCFLFSQTALTPNSSVKRKSQTPQEALLCTWRDPQSILKMKLQQTLTASPMGSANLSLSTWKNCENDKSRLKMVKNYRDKRNKGDGWIFWPLSESTWTKQKRVWLGSFSRVGQGVLWTG